MNPASNEIAVFLGAFYGGIVIGLCYTLLRLPRLLYKRNVFMDGIFDAFFYALAGAVAAFTFYKINGGALRIYILFALGLGIYCEIRTVDLLLHKAFKKFTNYCTKNGKKLL